MTQETILDLKAKVANLKTQLIDAQRALMKAIEEERRPLIKKLLVDLDRTDLTEEDLEIGGWECKASPFGECVYEYGKEECLCCEGPWERK